MKIEEMEIINIVSDCASPYSRLRFNDERIFWHIDAGPAQISIILYYDEPPCMAVSVFLKDDIRGIYITSTGEFAPNLDVLKDELVRFISGFGVLFKSWYDLPDARGTQILREAFVDLRQRVELK